jgi:hypothetical protein
MLHAAVVAQACSRAPGLERLYTNGANGRKCARDIEQLHHIRIEVVRRPGNGTTGTLHDAAQAIGAAEEIKPRVRGSAAALGRRANTCVD